MTQTEVGTFLRDLRTAAGVSQTQIAEDLDVSPNYVSAVERGLRSPSWKLLVRYAKVAGVSVITILRRAGLLDKNSSTEDLEAEIAALVEKNPDFEELFKVAQEISETDPEVLPRVLEYARYLLRNRS